MTEWTLVTIPTTSIGDMTFAPDMLLALVGLGIRRLAPSGLLGFAFPLGVGFGFALRKYRSCIVGFPIPFVRFPAKVWLEQQEGPYLPAVGVGQSGFASGWTVLAELHTRRIFDLVVQQIA